MSGRVFVLSLLLTQLLERVLRQTGTAKKTILESAGFQSPSSEPVVCHCFVGDARLLGAHWCPGVGGYKTGCKFSPCLYPCLAMFRCTESVSLPLESESAVALALVDGRLANMKQAGTQEYLSTGALPWSIWDLNAWRTWQTKRVTPPSLPHRSYLASS